MTLNTSQREKLAELAVKNPVVYDAARYVETGGLMSYGVDHPTWIVGEPRMWIKFSKEQNLVNSLVEQPRSLSW